MTYLFNEHSKALHCAVIRVHKQLNQRAYLRCSVEKVKLEKGIIATTKKGYTYLSHPSLEEKGRVMRRRALVLSTAARYKKK